MRLLSTFLLLVITVCQTTNGYAATQASIRSKMIDELDILKNTFEVRYAPVEWKKAYADWDLNEQIDIAKAKINSTPDITIHEFQKIIKEFFKTTRDYHVGVHFYSTEFAALPFRVQGDGHGRYFLAWIDENQVPDTWSIGDEVIAFGHQSPEDAIQKIKAEDFGNPESLTDQGLAELYLTFRIRALGHQVPKGNINITLNHLSEKIASYGFEWIYSPEAINPGPYKPEAQAMALMNKKFEKKRSLLDSSLANRQMIAFQHEHVEKALSQLSMAEDEDDDEDDDSFRLIGNRKSFIPELGKVIWASKNTDFFHAYLYKTPSNKTIGYIRIATYMASEKEAFEFAKILKLFQLKSDALVIDQINNPGGRVFYMFALASMLSSTPLEVQAERISITQSDISEAIAFLDDLETYREENQLASERSETVPETTFSGYPITLDLINGFEMYYRNIISEWEAGRHITNPIQISGITALKPSSRVQYTKPILFLINHLAFSCGDFMPAILKDNDRVTTLGTTTAGAGGSVHSHSYPNRFGIAGYSFTASIAERTKGKMPIENLGVTPDIHYQISSEDLQNNYVDYVNAINEAVEALVDNQPVEILPITPVENR